MSLDAAIENLRKFPRLRFGFYPTPIEELTRLRTFLGANCPRLFIKRDDYTGFGFGGNKIRKLEFLLAQMVFDGIDAVVTTGGERSNHARMTAAVCAKLGIKCVLVLDRKPRPSGTEKLETAPIFIERLLGAEVHIVDSIAERKKLASSLTAEMKQRGLKVLEIPLGGAVSIAALGFVTAMRELAKQQQESAVEFDHIFFSSSTGGTHAGMLVGSKLFGLEKTRFIGISPEENAETEISLEVKRLTGEVREILQISTDDLFERIEVYDRYAGLGYCVETAEAKAAMKMLAKTEGIFLDPVYTAKAMAGLFNWIKEGKLNKENKILFWHTGGQMTLFYRPTENDINKINDEH